MTSRLLLPVLAAAALSLAGCEALMPPNPFLIAYLATEGPCSLPGSELLPDCGIAIATTTPAGRPVPVQDDEEFPEEFVSLGFDSELLTDDRLDFGSLEPGWTSTATIVLFNDGAEPVSGSIFLDRGDQGFRLAGSKDGALDSLEFDLEPGDELAFDLVFAPDRADDYADRLRVEDEDGFPLVDVAVRGTADGLSET